MAIAVLSCGTESKTMKRHQKDRFDIEREQRTQNRVMGGCAAAIILMLVLMIACAGCSSQKHSHSIVADSISTAVDSTAVHHTRTDSGVVNWLTFAIRHLKMQLAADSVTLPSGAVLYAPRLMAEADNLTADKGSAVQTHHEQSDSAAVKAAMQATHEATEDEAKETTAVSKPPDASTICLAAAVIVAAVAATGLIIKKFRK